MNYCGKLVTMGHGDNAKCGEDYWGSKFQCDTCTIKDLKKCHAPDASNAEKESSGTGALPLGGQSMLAVLTQLLSNSEKMHLEMLDQKERINDLRNGMEYLASHVKTLTDALAEDQDPDQPISNYLSGKPV